MQINTLAAEGVTKTKLLENVNKLKKEQTALVVRMKIVFKNSK